MAGGLTFRPVEGRDAERLFHWRLSDHVAKRMTTPGPASFDAHVRWLDARLNDPDFLFWIIEAAGAPIGMVNVARLTTSPQAVTWGYYIGEESHLGLGAMIPPMLYNALFMDGPCRHLEAEVLSDNSAVQAMHQAHGYVRTPDLDRAAEGRRLLASRLDRNSWREKTRYHRLRADFAGLADFFV